MADALTIETWIKPSAWDNIYAGYNRIVSKQPVYLLRGAGSHGHFQILTENHGFQGVSTPTSLATDRWYYLVATFDGQNLKLYVNGTLASSLTLPVPDRIVQNESPIYIGESPLLNEGFSGQIDNVILRDQALSDQEIRDNYLSGGCPEKLALDLRFESAANPTPDLSVNANNGTVQGAQFQIGSGVCGSGSMEFAWSQQDNIRVPDHSSLNASGQLTLEAWVYPTAWDNIYAGYNRIISRQPVYLLRGADGYGYFQILTENQGFQGVSTPAPLALNQWHYLVATFDGIELRLFDNGVLVTSLALTTADNIAAGFAPVDIGESPILNEGFSGFIDNVRVLLRARDTDEINLINSGGGCF